MLVKLGACDLWSAVMHQENEHLANHYHLGLSLHRILHPLKLVVLSVYIVLAKINRRHA